MTKQFRLLGGTTTTLATRVGRTPRCANSRHGARVYEKCLADARLALAQEQRIVTCRSPYSALIESGREPLLQKRLSTITANTCADPHVAKTRRCRPAKQVVSHVANPSEPRDPGRRTERGDEA
jgi:hypothetical protein